MKLFSKPAAAIRRQLQGFKSRPLSEEERKAASHGYAFAASVFARKSVGERLPAAERLHLVERLLSRTKATDSKKYLAKRFGKIWVPFTAAPLGAYLAFGNVRDAALAGSAAAAGTAAMVVLSTFAKGTYRPRSDSIRLHRPNWRGTPGTAAHEAIHYFGHHGVISRDNIVAGAASTLYYLRKNPNLAPKPKYARQFEENKAPKIDLKSESPLRAANLGIYAHLVGESVGSKKAAWDFLYLVSRGVPALKAKEHITEIHAARPAKK